MYAQWGVSKTYLFLLRLVYGRNVSSKSLTGLFEEHEFEFLNTHLGDFSG